ncbi:UDP-N-acetylglucosamine 1-carboxyvinyltransferase [Patescibacteria group bacterium]|nr:UDP-N-acetylglucosamine 1-carboxyvinyltransferase [Patescibacteria group bacterium]
MSSYIVQGGKKLKGEVTVNASKNSAVAILIASLLNEKKTILMNVPRIEEVFRVIEVLESIGVFAKWRTKKKLEIIPPRRGSGQAQKFNLKKINKEAASRTRIMILLVSVLAHKFKSFELPMYGGCKLGKRTIMPHIYALENFGIEVKILGDSLKINHKKLHPSEEIIMYESGDTATENVIMAASLISGKTVIKFASANYQVQDLCYFLKKLGVRIDGIGTTTLTIFGRKRIKKQISYHLTEDPVESMLFLASAAVTKSSIIIKRCPIEFLELELLKLKKMGFKFKILKKYLAKNGYSRLVDIKTYSSKLIAPIEKLYARPFPGLNIDNLPFFVPIATQAKGTTLIHDWVYENRAVYYMELNRLGAKITLADPHRVFIEGPTKLKGAEMMSPPALRPSAIILVAMLAAKGRSVLKNTYAIERGYEDLAGRLKKLGAKIWHSS